MKDVCHFVSDLHFCIRCMGVRCSASINDHQSDKLYQFCHVRRFNEAKQALTPCSFCGAQPIPFETQWKEANQTLEQLQSLEQGEAAADDSVIQKSRTILRNFASVLNQKFNEMAKSQGSPLRGDSVLVAMASGEYLRKGSKDETEYLSNLSQWVSSGNVLAISVSSSDESSLKTSANSGHCESICVFLEKYMKSGNISECRKYLSLLMRGIGSSDAELDSLVERVSTCVAKQDDPTMNQTILEYYLDRYHATDGSKSESFNCRALKWFQARRLPQDVRLSIARRETRNYNCCYQRHLSLELLRDLGNHSSVRQGALLFAEVAGVMWGLGKSLRDIFPTSDESDDPFFDQCSGHVTCGPFHRFRGLRMIADEDISVVSRGFEVLKHAFLCGCFEVWYDLLSLTNSTQDVRRFIPLLSWSTIIGICSSSPVYCYEELSVQMKDKQGKMNKCYSSLCKDPKEMHEKSQLLDVFNRSSGDVELFVSRMDDYVLSQKQRQLKYRESLSHISREWEMFRKRLCEQHESDFIRRECGFIRTHGGICGVMRQFESILDTLETDERSVEQWCAFIRCAKEEGERKRDSSWPQETLALLERLKCYLEFCVPRYPWVALDIAKIDPLISLAREEAEQKALESK